MILLYFSAPFKYTLLILLYLPNPLPLICILKVLLERNAQLDFYLIWWLFIWFHVIYCDSLRKLTARESHICHMKSIEYKQIRNVFSDIFHYFADQKSVLNYFKTSFVRPILTTECNLNIKWEYLLKKPWLWQVRRTYFGN